MEPKNKQAKWHRIATMGENLLEGGFNNLGGNEAQHRLYAWRIRMNDVPIISDNTLSESDFVDHCSYNDNDDIKCNDAGKLLQSFVDETSYLFCEGSEGYIQSNAKRMNNDGEATGETSKKEDQVYPFIEMVSGEKSCLDFDQNNRVSLSSYVTAYGSPDNFACNEVSDMGSSEVVFSEEKKDGGIFETELKCGGTKRETEIPRYGGNNEPFDIEYWTPQTFLSGCSERVSLNIVGRGERFDTGRYDYKSGWKTPTRSGVELKGKPTFTYETNAESQKTVLITLETPRRQENPKIVVASNNTEAGKRYYIKDLRTDMSYTETISGVGDTTEIKFVDDTVETRENAGPGGYAGPAGNPLQSYEVTKIKINGKKIAELGKIGDINDMKIETLTLNNRMDTRRSQSTTPGTYIPGRSEEVDEAEKEIINEDDQIENSYQNLNLEKVIIDAQPAVCGIIP